MTDPTYFCIGVVVGLIWVALIVGGIGGKSEDEHMGRR